MRINIDIYMSNLKAYQAIKKQILDSIMEIIKKNPKIKSDMLVAKLNVDPPYLREAKSIEIIRNLTLVGKIKINDNDEVSICQ